MPYDAVVLYYQRGPDVLQTIAHLTAQTVPPARIVLVDNASGDGVLAELEDQLPSSCEVLTLPANGGYASGMNGGVGALDDPGAPFVLFLTHEVLLAPDAVQHMLDAAQRQTAAVVGPALRLPTGALWSLGGSLTRRGQAKHDLEVDPAGGDARPVEWLDGSTLLVRRSVFDAVGGFDPDFFMYWEDVDFCRRAARHGPVIVAPDALAQQDTGRAPIYFAARNRILFWRKRRRYGLVAIAVVEAVVKLLRDATSRGGIERARARMQGVSDGLRGTRAEPAPFVREHTRAQPQAREPALRVLFATHDTATAGAERSLVTLLRAAVDDGCEVVLGYPRPGPLLDEIRQDLPTVELVAVRTRPWMMPVTQPSWRRGLRTVASILDITGWVRLLREEDPDLVVVNSSVIPAPALAARMLGVPSVWIVRESLMSDNPTLAASFPKTWLLRLLTTSPTVLVAISQYVRDQLGVDCAIEQPAVSLFPQRAPSARASVLPWSPGAEDGGIDRRVPTLVLVGTIAAEKGQQDAVEAVRILAGLDFECRLLLVGKGDADAVDSLSRQIQASGLDGSVEYLGTTNDIGSVYARADATLMCSRNEAYGRVTMESILAGVPVIGYDAGGTAEILRDGGGILVEPNPEALAEGVLHVLGSPETYQRLVAECDASRSRYVPHATEAWSRIVTAVRTATAPHNG